MLFFQNAYTGTPTWDIGRSQPAILGLLDGGAFDGVREVLDIGCGTGENALCLASRGLQVVGVDFAEEAIERARAKAAARGLAVEFAVEDALDLGRLDRVFDAAIDVGLFHCLQPADRARYAASAASVLRRGAALFLLEWSDRNPFGRGPERVSQRDLRSTFRHGWTVEAIESSRLETNLPEGHVHAWLTRVRRSP